MSVSSAYSSGRVGGFSPRDAPPQAKGLSPSQRLAVDDGPVSSPAKRAPLMRAWRNVNCSNTGGGGRTSQHPAGDEGRAPRRAAAPAAGSAAGVCGGRPTAARGPREPEASQNMPEMERQIARRLKALLLVLLEAATDNRHRHRRQVGLNSLEISRVLLEDRGHGLHGRRTLERARARVNISYSTAPSAKMSAR